MSKRDLQRQIDEIKARVGMPSSPPDRKPLRMSAVLITKDRKVSADAGIAIPTINESGTITAHFIKAKFGNEYIAAVRFLMPYGVQVEVTLKTQACWYMQGDSFTATVSDTGQIRRIYDVVIAAEDAGVKA